jgi:hypothetical protein
MTSDSGKEPDLDALWDFDLEEGAGDPSVDDRKVPAGQRDTIRPPLPKHEYVQAMMQLGDLDDPDGRATSPHRPASGLAERIGLVLANEDELLLAEDGDRPTMPGPDPEELMRARAEDDEGRHFFDRIAKPSAHPPPVPRKAAPPPPPKAAGFRAASNLAARSPGALPIPRAPSIPPGADLDAAQRGTRPRGGIPAADPIDVVPIVEPPSRPGLSRTPSSGGGLRLRKTTPQDRGFMTERVTPVADDVAPSSVVDNTREMLTRFESRNYGGALVLAESVLFSDPSNVEARRTAESCREKLADKYRTSLGGPTWVPRIAMTPDEVRVLALDHRAGFLLSFVDGAMSIEEVLDGCSMPELDALRMMFELRQQGVIEIDEPPRRTGRRM